MSEDCLIVTDPYNQEILAALPLSRRADIESAVQANLAFPKDLSISKRKEILKGCLAKIEEQEAELALQITREAGLCLKDTTHEVRRSAEVVRVAIEYLDSGSLDREKKSDFRGGRLSEIKEPFDLILAITPFNHPLNQVCHKIIPAIAAGAPILLKPCEKTPLSAIALLKILLSSGMPEEMLQLLITNQPDEVVNSILQYPQLEMLSFTGGRQTGFSLARAVANGANPMLRQVYELGGSSPLVIMDDADLPTAVKVAMEIFKNSGQRCTTSRKILVAEQVADQFTEALVAKAQELLVDDPKNPDTDVGTLINEEAAEIVEARVNAAIRSGARLALGNKRQGAQFWPTILLDTPLNSELIQEETFGPVAPILKVKNLAEAVAVVESNNYRLAGSMVSSNLEQAAAFAKRIAVGQFSWNGPSGFRLESAPFGGFKDSGNAAKEGVIMAAQGYLRTRTFYQHFPEG